MIFVITDEHGVYVNRVVAESKSDIAIGVGQTIVDDDPSNYTMPTVESSSNSGAALTPEQIEIQQLKEQIVALSGE